jgi:hypothetical protein
MLRGTSATGFTLYGLSSTGSDLGRKKPYNLSYTINNYCNLRAFR